MLASYWVVDWRYYGVRYLLEKGADTTIEDARWGETPYDWAGYYDNDAMRKTIGAHDAAAKETKKQ